MLTPEERARIVVKGFKGDHYWIDTDAAIVEVADVIRTAVKDATKYTIIVVPHDQAKQVAVLLRRFSTGFDGATDGKTTEYHVFNLRVADLVLALLQCEGGMALQMQYPNTD